MLGAFFGESVDQLDEAGRIEVGGDFTIGGRVTAVKPDAEALLAADPALFERLEEIGRLRAKFIVDRSGAVRRVRFVGDVDQDLRQPFLDVLTVARFEPTTHYEQGPVIVERQIEYFVNPASQWESLYGLKQNEIVESPVDEQELSRRLADVYRLAEGRSLDLRPPPYPLERLALYWALNPLQALAVPSGPTVMSMVWRDGRLTIDGSCFGCDDLVSLVSLLGVRRDAVRLAGGAENVEVIADVVKRDGALRDELLADLSEVLREKFDLDFSFQEVAAMSSTLVLRGSIGTVMPDEEYGGERYLHVFTDRKNEDPRIGAGGGPSADAGLLVRLLSSQFGMPVVDETDGAATVPFHVRVHDSAYRTRRLELVIRNLEAQTDLDFVVEERPDRLVEVSPAG